MPKCCVSLQYERMNVPLTLGVTSNMETLCLVKRQILKEATENLDAARRLGDPVMIAHFELTYERLAQTLDRVIAPEIEPLILRKLDDDHNNIESIDDTENE